MPQCRARRRAPPRPRRHHPVPLLGHLPFTRLPEIFGPIPDAQALRCPAPSRRGNLGRMEMRMGVLEAVPARERPDLVAQPVAAALAVWSGPVPIDEIGVAEIDPELADTAAFCERYSVGLDESANCVVVAARRGGETRLAACVVLATTRADVNGLVRRHLAARRASFAPLDAAVAETSMEYGRLSPRRRRQRPPPIQTHPARESPRRPPPGGGPRRSRPLRQGR